MYMKNGFITLLGLLIAFLLMGFLFVKMYTSKSPETQKTQIETYKQDVQKAEDIKNLLERRSLEESNY